MKGRWLSMEYQKGKIYSEIVNIISVSSNDSTLQSGALITFETAGKYKLFWNCFSASEKNPFRNIKEINIQFEIESQTNSTEFNIKDVSAVLN